MKIKILHIIKSLGRGGAEMLLPKTIKNNLIISFSRFITTFIDFVFRWLPFSNLK
jgi:hypothetical protein